MYLMPYLFFDRNCLEAMTFYHECLGGVLDVMKVGDSPTAVHMPEDTHDLVMHSYLSNDKVNLYGSDMVGPAGITVGTSMAVCLSGKIDDVEALFGQLSAGGTVTQPLIQEFFGTFGAFTDKFGQPWMIQADPADRAEADAHA